MAYIYKITNLINNKIYIGETIRSIKSRWNQHCYQAKNQEKSHLHCAMRMYGIDNFKIEQIEFCKNEERFERETYYIKLFNCLEPNGYNWVLAQHGITNELIEALYSSWEEGLSIKKISDKYHMDPKRVSKLLQGQGVSQESVLKRKNQSVGLQSSKAVIQYSMIGDIVNEFSSSSEAGKILNLNNASISKACKGDLLTYNGYIWQYKSDDCIEQVLEKIEKKNKTGKNKKTIGKYDLNNNFIESYESASAAGRALNKSHAGIARAAREGCSAYGYKWKYL